MGAKKGLLIVVLTLVIFPFGTSWGAPHHGEIVKLRQPDGSRVEVKVYGDEFYQRVESIDGFTLVRDPETEWICYAQAAPDGESFISTGVIYWGASAEDLADSKKKEKIKKLVKHLKLKKGAVKRKAEARRAVLFAGQEEAEGPTVEGEISPAPLTGSLVGLTILIQFPDVPGTITPAEVESFCNQVGYTGYGNKGSVRDYFYDVSNQMLEYTNIVTQYYTAVHEKSYYDDCDNGRTRELLGEALDWLDGQGFDFNALSLSSSNRMRALNAFYAGGRDCGWSKGLWPHKGYYGSFTSSSGVRSGDYQITNIGSQLRLGTFCHENGHMICGWPDLYDYGSESRGVGGYCLMASSGSTNPRFPNPHFRDLKGWEAIIDITDDAPGTLRTHQTNSFTTYRYSHPINTREFFLVESRLKIGRHAGIPDEGLLIWHIDRDGSNNNEQMTPEKHYRVSVEQADGLFHLENDKNGGGGGDLFHAGYKDTFDDYTLPDARWWDGAESGMRIRNISEVGTEMEMTFVVDNNPMKLWIQPGAEQEMSGLAGGPFAPSEVSYTLTNQANSTIEWDVSSAAAWLSVPSGGIITTGGSTVVNISLTSEAESLSGGTYSATVLFTDVTNGSDLEREVRLVVQPRELIAHWKLDETTGTEVGDSTGHGNEGRLVGGVSFGTSSVAGRFDWALDIDGVDDTLFFEGFALPRPYFTISLWFNPDSDLSSSSSRDDFLYWDNGDHPHITFNRRNDGKIGLYVEYDTVQYEDIVTATQSWSASMWHHVVFTFDGTDYNVYAGGSLEKTYNHPGIHIHTVDPYVGSRKGDDNFFDGRIDDVRFYNYALPAEAVSGLYLGGRAENPSPADMAANVRPYTALKWLAGASAVSHDVYVGSDFATVANAAMLSEEYKGRITEEFITGLPLKPDTEYFWRINEAISGRDIINGAIWSFVTGKSGGYEEIYEAEDAYLSGPSVALNNEGYTGTGFADYANATGDYVEWTVFAHYTGSHEIAFRYALKTGNRPLEIKVNGQVVDGSLSFPATGAWSNWSYADNIFVTLNDGYNTVRATATGSSGANVDHLKIIEDNGAFLPLTGLQVYFKLDGGRGTTAYDSSDNTYDGTLYGGPVWDESGGRFGGALLFDGVDDYVEIPGYKGITGARSRTVAAWVKTNDQSSPSIVSWGTNGVGKNWSLVIDSVPGAFGVYVMPGHIIGTTNVMDNSWHHVAAVLDEGGVDVSDVRLYVDGRAEPVGSVAPYQLNTIPGQNVKVGTYDEYVDIYFKGLIDEVVIFDVALTEHQIAHLCRFGGESFTNPCGRILPGESFKFDGDINRDCRVDVFDFVFFAESWPLDGQMQLGDIDENNNTNWLDFSLLVSNWLEETTGVGIPSPASNPDPFHEAIGVRTSSVLSWQSGLGAESHDVYFGSSNPPAFKVNQTDTTYDPGKLAEVSTYYWRVDEVNPYGTTPGPVWKFTTTTGGGGR